MPSGQQIRVLVATQRDSVYEILEDRGGSGAGSVRYDIALYTGTIQELLPEVQLVIIDYDDIVEFPVPEAEIREGVISAEGAGQIKVCSSEEFVSDPDKWIEGLTVNLAGKMISMPEHYCIAFVSYSGGTGRTTLALDTAYYFTDAIKRYREREKRGRGNGASAPEPSAMAIELTYGISSFISVTGIDSMPSLMQLATDPESEMYSYRDVSFVPMDYDNVRMLDVELLERYLSRQMEKHVLTVVDGSWPHGQASALAKNVDLWIVVASTRPDTIINAQKLHDELSSEYQEDKVWLLQNQIEGEGHGNATATGERNSLGGQEPSWDIQVPRVARPDEFNGELGRVVLSKVFAPLWEQEYDKRKKSGFLS